MTIFSMNSSPASEIFPISFLPLFIQFSSFPWIFLAKLYLIKMLVKRFKLKVKIELMKDEGVVYLCFS